MFEQWLEFFLGPIWTGLRDFWANNLTWLWVPLLVWGVVVSYANRSRDAARRAVRQELRALGPKAVSMKRALLVKRLQMRIDEVASSYRHMPSRTNLWITACTPEGLAHVVGLDSGQLDATIAEVCS